MSGHDRKTLSLSASQPASKRALISAASNGSKVMLWRSVKGPPPGVTLQIGQLRIEGAQLEGHAPKSSLQGFLPNHAVTADRAVAEWVVSAPRGSHIALTAVADRAGTVRTEVTLD